MSPTKRCLVCPNTTRNQPKMIFVQMPHPKKDARTRKLWFAVYQNIVDYNEHLDSHLCSDHFDLENDASNLEYYVAKRMKKLLFKPHALPKPLPSLSSNSPQNYDYYDQGVIKEEVFEYVDTEEDQTLQEEQMLECEEVEQAQSDDDSEPLVRIKEEPLDIYEHHQIRHDPIDIKSEPHDAEEELSVPSPPPLVPAVTLVSSAKATMDNLAQQQQPQQPLIINSFQVASQQLRSQLLRLAAEGRLRVVNVSSADRTSTTPTLAVVADNNDGLVVNTNAGLIQKAAVAQQPQSQPPQLVQRPQPQHQYRTFPMMSGGQPVQTLRLANGQQLMMNGQVLQLRPTSEPIMPNMANAPRQQLVLPRGAPFVPAPPANQQTKLPSLAPLPMRSVFACNKCTELFYTTVDRDKHIETKHPGSLYVGSINAAKGKTAQAPEQKEFKCEICNATMPSSQKVAHLGTHETFKCVTCHQTLEKRIYAAHMITHIETPNNTTSPIIKPKPAIIKRVGQVKTTSRPYTIKKHPSSPNPAKILLSTPPPKQQTDNSKKVADDLTILEVKNLNSGAEESDVEKNLSEYMIAKDKKKRLLPDPLKTKPVDMGSGMEMYYLFTCKICRMAFRTKMELVSHREENHKDAHPTALRPTIGKKSVNIHAFIKCAHCFQDVIRSKITSHIRVMHPDRLNVCPFCKATFSHHHFAKHLRSVHNVHNMAQISNQPPPEYRLVDMKDVAPSKVDTDVQTSSSETKDDIVDEDYDEDFSLAMLLREPNGQPNCRYVPGLQSALSGLQESNEVEISEIDDDIEMEEEEEEEDDNLVGDIPEYVDISQYEQVLT